jgi:L-ascorbate metabolism protein UlaG (beta-lactamase superfamily)
MDNSWFIQLNGLSLLVDPWLEGTEVDYFGWFNTQWHRTPPLSYEQIPKYDLVLITQIYPDHFHQKTLLKLNPKQIIAPAALQKRLQKILPHAQIISLDNRHPATEIEGVKISLMPRTSVVGPVFNSYLLNNEVESVVVAPHGYNGNESSIKNVKLLITPFNRYRLPFFLGGTLSPGVEGLKRLMHTFNPKHVVCTHDEDKHATGLVSKLAKIKRISAQELAKDELFKKQILEINDYQPMMI